MKQLARLVLLVVAFTIGGTLGFFLLPGDEPIKVALFGAVVIVLGNALYQIGKKIS